VDTSSILRSLGIKQLDAVPTAANYPYSIVLPFSALAAGGTVTVQDVCQRSKTFVLDEITGVATIDSAITGTANTSQLTDSTGGTVSTTLAAITAGASYAQADLTAIKNAIASLASAANLTLAAAGAQYTYAARSELAAEPRGGIPPLSALSVALFSTRGDWSSTSMQWPTVVGTARFPRIPMFKPVLAGGNLVGARITNNSAVTVSGSIVLHGRYLGAV
jgi:hypothetical protein